MKTEKKKLSNIYTIIQDDLKNDLKEIEKIESYYKNIAPLFNKVLKDSVTRKDYVLNPQYVYLAVGFPEITFNKRGYNLLTNFNTNSYQDSLPTQIIEFYTERLREIKIDDEMRASDFKENYSHFKKNYTWWADVISFKPNNDFVAYALHDPDYKNRIATIYFIAYKVFLPELRTFKKQAEVFIEEIEKQKE